MRAPRLFRQHGDHAGARKRLRKRPAWPPLVLAAEPEPGVRLTSYAGRPVSALELIEAHQVLLATPLPANPRDPVMPAWELAVALAELRRAAHVLYTAAAWCADEHLHNGGRGRDGDR